MYDCVTRVFAKMMFVCVCVYVYDPGEFDQRGGNCIPYVVGGVYVLRCRCHCMSRWLVSRERVFVVVRVSVGCVVM